MEDVNKVLEETKKINDEYNYLNTIIEKPIQRKKEGKLSNYYITFKDAICVKGVHSRAGSSILEGYYPLFNATVVEKCLDEGAILLGKTTQDTFGFGSFNINTNLNIPKHPLDKSRVTGGSSGGSCGFTKKVKFKHISLGESTGGSMANPSSLCGVFSLTPTYGLVSRYGLMDYANSMDKIGPIANSMKEIAIMLEVISGNDEKDSTSLNSNKNNICRDYSKQIGVSLKGMRVGILKESFNDSIDEGIKNSMKKCIDILKSVDVECEEISLPFSLKYGIPTYYIIATSEASTNLARYCGIRYGAYLPLEGNFNEYFSKVRSTNFHPEAKRRIILGTFVRMATQRDAYYLKAAKIRTKIIEEYKEIFKKYDVILSPAMPIVAPKFDEVDKLTPLQSYMMDIFTVSPNLAGVPHLTVPFWESNNLPVGLMFIADHLKENNLIRIGSYLEGMDKN